MDVPYGVLCRQDKEHFMCECFPSCVSFLHDKNHLRTEFPYGVLCLQDKEHFMCECFPPCVLLL